MKIEVWSDFVCPCCYVGIHTFELALENLPFHENIYIEFKSYELDPKAGKNSTQSIPELLASQYDMTIEEAKQMNIKISKQASEINLTYNLDSIQYMNTFDAHRLTKYAAKQNKGFEMAKSLLKASFTESINMNNHSTLIKLANEVGLNSDEVEDILHTCKYTNSVRLDEEQTKEIGIQTVPFFVFNEKYAIAGAQSTDVFLHVITKVWEEEKTEENNEFRMKQSKQTYCCDSEGCHIVEGS